MFQLSPEEAHNAIMYCIHFYLCLNNLRAVNNIYQNHSKLTTVETVDLEKLAQDQCIHEMQLVW